MGRAIDIGLVFVCGFLAFMFVKSLIRGWREGVVVVFIPNRKFTRTENPIGFWATVIYYGIFASLFGLAVAFAVWRILFK